MKLSERLSYISLLIFVLSFFVFATIKLIIIFGLARHSVNIDCIEICSFIIMITSLGFSIRKLLSDKATIELKNTQKSELLQLRLDAIDNTNSILEFSPDGVILSVNKNFRKTFGYCNGIVGKHHSILVPEKLRNRKEYKHFWTELAAGKHKFGQFHRINSDGDDVYIVGTYVPIKNKDNEVYKIFKIAQDNTEKFKTLEQLHNKNVYLEHAAKIIRHDMHSGINTYIPRGIKSLLRRLGDGVVEELKIGAPIRLITEGLAHTQQVYRGVFEFTNLVKDNAKIQTDDYDIKVILQAHLKRTSYYDKIKIEPMPIISVNESLFCTAVDNLIRNGLKYNDSLTKCVKIYYKTVKNDSGNDDNYIIIEDNGRGMTQDEFDEFSKPYVRREGQVEGGTGLGLNICSLILKEHGFSISCEKTKLGTKLMVKI